jgi:hypothetical protein
MSDNSISIVPKKSTYYNKEAKAKEILEWLISRDIVKSEILEFSLNPDYAFSDGAEQITNFPDRVKKLPTFSGLDIITSRAVFDTGENGMEECICPNCKKNIAQEDWDFLNNWYEEKSDDLICPLCNVATDIHEYNFDPEWGFSDLSFTFWSLDDLKDSFINEFKEKLSCNVSVVHQHL